MKNRFIVWAFSLYNLFCKKRAVSSEKRCLVISTTALGDTIWGTPALHCLRQSFPNSIIDVLTSKIGSDVLQANPNIDQIFVLPKNFFRLCALCFKMRKKKYDYALIFHTSQRHILPFCHLLGIPEIIGLQGEQKGLDCLLSQKMEKKHVHAIDHRLAIISSIHAKLVERPIEIFFSEEEKKFTEEFLQKNGVDFSKPLIAIHPGANDRFKQWRPEAFVKVARKLKEHSPCNLLVTGSHKESDLVRKIADQIPGAIPVCGDLPIKPFTALIQKLDLLIIGDTGPMHIAFSQNTTTIALFCATDPQLCGPHRMQPNIELFSRKPTCTPCLKKRCNEPFCLLQISPEMVFDSAIRLLGIQK